MEYFEDSHYLEYFFTLDPFLFFLISCNELILKSHVVLHVFFYVRGLRLEFVCLSGFFFLLIFVWLVGILFWGNFLNFSGANFKPKVIIMLNKPPDISK